MAAYYDTAIVPVRVCHRQDKSHAEGGVKFASTLKHHRFRKRPYIRLRFLQNYTTLKRSYTAGLLAISLRLLQNYTTLKQE